jgi:hypothetical protein
LTPRQGSATIRCSLQHGIRLFLCLIGRDPVMVFLCPLGYIDPMSGTILLQVLIAAAIGTVAFFQRSIWGVVRRIAGRRAAAEVKQDETESVSDTDLPQSRAA